jgi:hypothetical protein
LPAERFFEIHAELAPRLPLALNVKSDGLQSLVCDMLERFSVYDAFLFDMSIPDAVGWLRSGVRILARHSDLEPEPSLYSEAMGVWLDGFSSDWWTCDVIRKHLDADKKVYVVSPELHGRDHLGAWQQLFCDPVSRSADVALCTDFPEQAKEMFGHGD